MKKGIFDSRENLKLLFVMCRQPSRYFSARELALRARLGEALVKRILGDFSKHRLLNYFEKKQQRYYQINRDANVFVELVKILSAGKYHDKEVLENILRNAQGLKFAALSGLFIGHSKSGADLLLVGELGEKPAEKLISKIEEIAGNEINYALMPEKEFRQRIYSYDWFVKEVMDRNPVVVFDKIGGQKDSKGHKFLASFSNIKK